MIQGPTSVGPVNLVAWRADDARGYKKYGDEATRVRQVPSTLGLEAFRSRVWARLGMLPVFEGEAR